MIRYFAAGAVVLSMLPLVICTGSFENISVGVNEHDDFAFAQTAGTLMRTQNGLVAEVDEHARFAFEKSPSKLMRSHKASLAEVNEHAHFAAFEEESILPEGDMSQVHSASAAELRHSSLPSNIELSSICPHGQRQPDQHKWNGFKAMGNMLNRLNAPWTIHGGLALGLVRDCDIIDYDLDFAVEHDWLQNNFAEVERAILEAGFTCNPRARLGTLKSHNFTWEKRFDGPVDSMRTMALAGRLKLVNPDGIETDLFSFAKTSSAYTFHMWVSGKPYVCLAKYTGTQPYSWLGVSVNVPLPTHEYLMSFYGKEYMTPMPLNSKWRWNIEPFTVGSCRNEVDQEALEAFLEG